METHQTLALNDEFLREYATNGSIRRYTKATAGRGINFLLNNDYGNIYLDVVENRLPRAALRRGVRLWEFGCGGGMNLIHIVSLLETRGIPVQMACGTDFSDAQVVAARREAQRDLSAGQRGKVQFCVARNESLIEDAQGGFSVGCDPLIGSFDFMLGVNTMRYCYRLKEQDRCARAIFNLLEEGGVCVVIDMNNRFPAFRSRLRDRLTKSRQAQYLPALDQYVETFGSAGFEILRSEHFCWVPHSAGTGLTAVMRAMTPILKAVVPDRAMRSLVIARKPAPRRP